MHRDIKTENVLIRAPTDAKGPPTSVCICDFGFATGTEPNNECVGSPQYSAPEIARIGMAQGRADVPTRGYTEKCDVWSLGVVTYALLSGMLPFDGRTPTDVFASILRRNIPFQQPIWRDVSDEAKRFILFLLTADPDQRPSARQALGHAWLVM
ncbi:protein kinase [Trypanosoma grayi]|uniref:protein kinase n=1 Tax=Trypanosoma grayi TaxID=71804 RepID=UPI0004F416FD|nr:protein kinase [Trypanosoma grayi]KEG05689.1 protein kinase [Trypanosoma grayi]